MGVRTGYSGEELAAVGFDDGAAVLRRAYSMVPAELLAPDHPDRLFDYVRSHFEAFQHLLHQYLAVADSQLLPALGDFIRENRQDFAAVLD